MTTIAGHAVGGEIDPPPGPIAPTMKSLDQIEPRVCVNDLPGSPTAVHLITQPGSYYLTGDILGEPGKSGIVVDLSQDTPLDIVTLDLNGFSLTGVAGSLHGIDVPASPIARVEKFAVRQDFGQVGGTRRWDGDGVRVMAADDCVLTGVNSEDNGGAGYRASGGPRFKAGADLSKKVNIANNGGGGAGGGIVLTGCFSVSLRGMDVTGNTGDGVSIALTTPEQTKKTLTLRSLRVSNNTGDGVAIDHNTGSSLRVRMNSVSMDSNFGDGLRIFADGGGVGISISHDASLDDIFAGNNGGNGVNIQANNAARFRVRVTDARFVTNVLNGMRCVDDGASVVTAVDVRNTSSSTNGLHGFETVAEAGRFESCTASVNSGNGFTNSAPASSTTRKGYDYYKAQSDNNAADGLNVTDAPVRVFDSRFTGNFGSGLRTSDSPLYTESTQSGENALYGLRATNGAGTGTTVTMLGANFVSNGSGGASVEGGQLVCGESSHFISNGGGGAGSGAGIEAIDVDSVFMADLSATGNIGPGVVVDNSLSGAPPRALMIDRAQASGNGGNGIYCQQVAYGSLRACVTNNNDADGVQVGATSLGLRIENSVSSGNAFSGYNLVGFGNTLVGNSASGNVGGAIKAAVPGNIVGPVIDEAGVATNGNPAANYVR